MNMFKDFWLIVRSILITIIIAMIFIALVKSFGCSQSTEPKYKIDNLKFEYTGTNKNKIVYDSYIKNDYNIIAITGKIIYGNVFIDDVQYYIYTNNTLTDSTYRIECGLFYLNLNTKINKGNNIKILQKLRGITVNDTIMSSGRMIINQFLK